MRASAQLSGTREQAHRTRYSSCPVRHRTSRRAQQSELQRSKPQRLGDVAVAPDMSGGHRTVRCTSAATAICAQRSTLQSEQYYGRSQSSSQRGTGLSDATPDCPVPQEDKAFNGRPAPSPNGRMTWRRTGHCLVAHQTVRCALRQHTSPTARFWLVAINTTPTGHFKVWEPKQHSKSSS
jgi:hypothetical protein